MQLTSYRKTARKAKLLHALRRVKMLKAASRLPRGVAAGVTGAAIYAARQAHKKFNAPAPTYTKYITPDGQDSLNPNNKPKRDYAGMALNIAAPVAAEYLTSKLREPKPKRQKSR